MATLQAVQTSSNDLLRRLIIADAATIFSLALLMLIFAQPVASFMGFAHAGIAMTIGVAGLLYDGGRLLWALNHETVGRGFAWLVIVGNIGFGLAMADLLLFTDILPVSNAGWWTLAILADVALVLGVVQYMSFRAWFRV